MEQLVTLYNQGESIRRVAKVLSLNRGTVRRYYRLLDEQRDPALNSSRFPRFSRLGFG